MTDPARGPTTEELRARALQHEIAEFGRDLVAARPAAPREPWASLRHTAEAQRHSSADVHGVSVRPSHLLTLLNALDAIRRNAEAWHGDDAAKGRALAVIARWAADPASIHSVLLDTNRGGSEGRTFYDPACPPLDSEGAERQ